MNPFEIVLLIFGIGVLPGAVFGYLFGRQRAQTQQAEKMLEVTENAEARLLTLQSTYAANARVMSTVQQMFSTLLQS